MDFLKAKSEEFRFGIKAAEEQLSARGMDASLSHQSLVALSEKLARLKQQTIPLKKIGILFRLNAESISCSSEN